MKKKTGKGRNHKYCFYLNKIIYHFYTPWTSVKGKQSLRNSIFLKNLPNTLKLMPHQWKECNENTDKKKPTNFKQSVAQLQVHRQKSTEMLVDHYQPVNQGKITPTFLKENGSSFNF